MVKKNYFLIFGAEAEENKKNKKGIHNTGFC